MSPSSSSSTYLSTPSSPSTYISTPSSPTTYISTPSSSSATPPSNSEESETRNWLDLPRDVTSMILLKVGTIEILNNAELVCTQWRNICNDPIMWRTIHVYKFPYPFYKEYNVKMMMWRHAIDRSRGNLVDITLEHFGSNDLLNYIADSASHLQRLRFVYCWEISDEGLSEVAKKLPYLEELDITESYLSKEGLEAIGRCCPLLKSLKLNIQSGYYTGNEVDDGEAFVIAKTMFGLRHLQLFGNKLTNDGLLAILDGCPLLQSLDLRRCQNVDLGGSLGRRCAEQIKVLLEPDDPTDDYPYYDEDTRSYGSCYTCRMYDDHNYDNSEQSDHEQNERRQQHESDHEQNAWLLDLDLGCYPYI